MHDATQPMTSSGLPREWLLCLGVPFITAGALFAAAVDASDGPSWLPELLFAPVLMLPMVWIGLLALLAISSDTNATRQAPVIELETRRHAGRQAA